MHIKSTEFMQGVRNKKVYKEPGTLINGERRRELTLKANRVKKMKILSGMGESWNSRLE